MDINQLSAPEMQDPVKPLHTADFTLLDWTLDIETQVLAYDSDTVRELIHLTRPLDNFGNLLKMMSGQCRKKFKAITEEVVKTGEGKFISCCLFPNEQELTYVEIYIELLNPRTFQGTLRPILTFPSRVEIANVFSAMFDNPHHGIIITDEDTRIIACNRYYEQQCGYEQSALVGLKTSILNAGKHSKQFFQKMWCALHEQGVWSGVMLSRNSRGGIYPQELTIQRLEPSQGKVFYVGMTVNLSKSLSQVAETELGGIELLTQLPTKERFLSQLEILLESKEKTTGVMVLGIQPQFDADTLFEDQKQFSDIISHMRGTRIPGYVGSYTFVVCLEFAVSEKGSFVQSVNSAIRRYCTEMKNLSTDRVYVAITKGKIGASILDVDAKTPNRLLSHAMQAMVGAKEYQGKYINYFHGHTHKEIVRKQYLETVIQQVLTRQLIDVHYQPIVDTQTGKVVMFEALCRFPVIKGEHFNTQEMIDLTEELGLITELDRAVSAIALKEHKTIRELFGNETQLTINCSLKTQGNAQHLLVETAKLISSSTDRPDLVTIEITENGHFASKLDQDKAIEKLGELGLSVAIDDFGSGYSSLSYLSEGYFNKLKIDRELIVDIHKNPNKFNIIKMITRLSHTLGVKVIAEGIEQAEELGILQLLNVDYIQGYLFDKPRKLSDLPSLLDKHDCDGLFKEKALPDDLSQSIYKLFRNAPPQISSGSPLSLAAQYLEREMVMTVPVIVDKKCVGLLDKQRINLHMTPGMGTDVETEKEAKIWKKPVNQIMAVKFTTLDLAMNVSEIPSLVEKGTPYPWVLVDGRGHYKGLIHETDIVAYCMPWID